MRESDKIIEDKYGIKTPFDLTKIQPKVSIVMATRNRPELVQEAIKSIKQINYDNYELIIVDDCSNPEISQLLVNEQLNYKELIVVRLPENLGSSGARRKGINLSNGQFLFFTDDDDLVLPNRISSPLSYILENPLLDVVYCNYNVVDDDGNISPIQCQPFQREAYLKLEFYIGLGILFGRRNVFLDVPFYTRYDQAADFDWVFRLLRKGYNIDLCPEIVMNYNRSGNLDHHLSGTKASFAQHKDIYEREILLENMKRL